MSTNKVPNIVLESVDSIAPPFRRSAPQREAASFRKWHSESLALLQVIVDALVDIPEIITTDEISEIIKKERYPQILHLMHEDSGYHHVTIVKFHFNVEGTPIDKPTHILIHDKNITDAVREFNKEFKNLFLSITIHDDRVEVRAYSDASTCVGTFILVTEGITRMQNYPTGN